MMHAYSAPPFNITSDVTAVQGTPGRPIVDSEFIERNAGDGTPFVSLNTRVSQTFGPGGRPTPAGSARGSPTALIPVRRQDEVLT